jgi:hypothetical protein
MCRSLPRLAPVLALTVVLGACGGGSDDEPRAEDPSSASPSPVESESSEPTESASPTEVEPSGLTPAVSEEAAQGYIQALTDARLGHRFLDLLRDLRDRLHLVLESLQHARG